MIVAIGPCISVKSYEVKKKFKDMFIKKDKKNIKFFKNIKIRFILIYLIMQKNKLN